MSKAFINQNSEDQADHDAEIERAQVVPAGAKNYISPAGYVRLKSELLDLLDVQRPEVVKIVSWAASNGDRSENGDYIYGKRRLREIDKRIRFLTGRIDCAEVVQNIGEHPDRVFFGATVSYSNQAGQTNTVTIVGIDEIDPLHKKVSWIAPIARALIKAQVGDVVRLQTPTGWEDVEVEEIEYRSS